MTPLLFLPVEDIKTNVFIGFNESKNRDQNDSPVTLTLQGICNVIPLLAVRLYSSQLSLKAEISISQSGNYFHSRTLTYTYICTKRYMLIYACLHTNMYMNSYYYYIHTIIIILICM